MRFRTSVFAALAISVASDALAQALPGAVDIIVTVSSSANSAHVEQRYVLAPSQAPLELRVLTRPCATIENVRIEPALGLTQSQSGPWTTWRDSAVFTDSLRLVVSYDVRRGGKGAVPLLHVAAAMGAVTVTVRFDDDGRRVRFPHMTRTAPGEWSARYVAAPSFIDVGGVRSGPCEEGEDRGDNGGLVWRFFLLVGIMVAWVPLYLAWARRSSKGDGA